MHVEAPATLDLTDEEEALLLVMIVFQSAPFITEGRSEKSGLTRAQLVRLAKRCEKKQWSFEDLKYGDDLYGKEELAEDVWELVEERKRLGADAWDAMEAAAELAEKNE
jgi:hypothetical protein